MPPFPSSEPKGEREKKEWKRCKLFKIINFTPSNQKIQQAIFGVGAAGFIGATISFTTEVYRRFGVWFIEKVNEANEFFKGNPLYFYQSAGFY